MRRPVRMLGLCAVMAGVGLTLWNAAGGSAAPEEGTHAKPLLASSVATSPRALALSVPATTPAKVHETDFQTLLNLAATLRDSADIPEPHPAAPVVPMAPAAEQEDDAEQGGKPAPVVERPEQDSKKVQKPAGKYREIWAVVTAYCPCSRCCGRNAAGITSQGTSAWKPGVAADPRAISYGTKLFIPGYGTYVVDDTGGAMRRSWRNDGRVHVDIRMTYHWQAKEWGRKYMKIRLYQ